MKTAQHGSGQNIYYVRFQYVPGPARAADKKKSRRR